MGGGRSSISGCIKKGKRSLSLVNPKRGRSGVTEAWVGGQGKRTLIFLGIRPEHKNCPLRNAGPPLAGSSAQQLAARAGLHVAPLLLSHLEYLLNCRFQSPGLSQVSGDLCGQGPGFCTAMPQVVLVLTNIGDPPHVTWSCLHKSEPRAWNRVEAQGLFDERMSLWVDGWIDE